MRPTKSQYSEAERLDIMMSQIKYFNASTSYIFRKEGNMAQPSKDGKDNEILDQLRKEPKKTRQTLAKMMAQYLQKCTPTKNILPYGLKLEIPFSSQHFDKEMMPEPKYRHDLKNGHGITFQKIYLAEAREQIRISIYKIGKNYTQQILLLHQKLLPSIKQAFQRFTSELNTKAMEQTIRVCDRYMQCLGNGSLKCFGCKRGWQYIDDDEAYLPPTVIQLQKSRNEDARYFHERCFKQRFQWIVEPR